MIEGETMSIRSIVEKGNMLMEEAMKLLNMAEKAIYSTLRDIGIEVNESRDIEFYKNGFVVFLNGDDDISLNKLNEFAKICDGDITIKYNRLTVNYGDNEDGE